MSVNLGRVAYVEKGAYDSLKEYQSKDVVAYNSGSYVYIGDTPATGKLPTDTDYWQVLLDPTAMNENIAEMDGVKQEALAAAATASEKAQEASIAANTANTAAEAADNARLAIADELNKKAPAIYVDASGDSVSITDGAAMPVQSLVSHIEPVQEGEGYPSPENVRPIIGWDNVNLWRGPAYDETVSATLTAELPETVYGGTLDWTTGVLTVHYKHLTIDSVAAVYTRGGEGFFGGSLTVSGMRSNARTDGYCDCLNPLNSPSNALTSCITFGVNDKKIYMVFPESLVGTTLTSINDYLSANPVNVVYPLETLYTIQLAPQQLETLKGMNNIWSDAGATEVTYAADTKLYIDGKIAAIAAAIV